MYSAHFLLRSEKPSPATWKAREYGPFLFFEINTVF